MSEPPPPYTAAAYGDGEKHGTPDQGTPYPPQGGQYPSASGYPQHQQQQPYPASSGVGYGGYGPVATNQPVGATVFVVTNQQFRDVPVNTVCQFCHQQVITNINFKDGLLTYLACAGICLIGCDLGCCLIPFCLDSCKDVVHTCPNCKQKLGRFARI